MMPPDLSLTAQSMTLRKTMSAMKNTIVSLRPRQWIKNLFVLTPLLFSTYLFDTDRLVYCLMAFVIFCATSGAIYLINDIVDNSKDKLHPEKSKRPIAAGDLSIKTAAVAAMLLISVSLLCSFLVNIWLVIVILSYFALNLLYSFYIKHIVILDVMAIATGFILRVEGGAVAISIQPTHWLLICTALLALFLGFGKRRHELAALENNCNGHRKVLQHYSPYFLDQMISVVTASTVLSYILYTISEETVRRFGSGKLLLTVPFVLYGIFRYLFLIHKKGSGGDPTNTLMHDLPSLINIFSWAVSAAILIYFVG
jgi:4-hydroxybenzoate polyprenyltransferase